MVTKWEVEYTDEFGDGGADWMRRSRSQSTRPFDCLKARGLGLAFLSAQR